MVEIMTKTKETNKDLSDFDVLVMHVDLAVSVAKRFKELNMEIAELKAENERLKDLLTPLDSPLTTTR